MEMKREENVCYFHIVVLEQYSFLLAFT